MFSVTATIPVGILWTQHSLCLILGQLRFWNPDDLNASHSGSCPPQDWIEEKLQEVCEDLGITRDGHLNRKKLISICEQYGLQNVDGAVTGCFVLVWGWYCGYLVRDMHSFFLDGHPTCTLFLSLGKSCCVAEIRADITELPEYIIWSPTVLCYLIRDNQAS